MIQRPLVGAFTSDMTPDHSELPIDEPVLATALTLREGTEGLVLVSVDATCLDKLLSDRIRSRLASVADVPIDRVHICATNTGYGPDLAGEANRERIQHACERAVANAIGVESAADLDVVSIRAPGFTLPADGRADDRLTLLRFSRAGYEVASVVHFACRPICGSSGEGDAVSSDFVHYLRRTLQEEIEAPVLYLQGAAADVYPASRQGTSRRLLGRGLGCLALLNRPQFRRVAEHHVHLAGAPFAVAESAWEVVAARLGPVDLVFLPFDVPSAFAANLDRPSALLATCCNGLSEDRDVGVSNGDRALGTVLSVLDALGNR